MRRRRSRSGELALGAAFAALVALASGRAHAQACCVAPGVAGVTRLAPGEAALVGLDARAETAVGRFDAAGRFARSAPGTRDLSLEQDVFGAVRLLPRVEASVAVPFLWNLRSTEAMSASGAGLGDVRATSRVTLVHADEVRPWPGVALTLGLSAPTGRPPESASDALGAGATGTGTTQGWAGVTLEQTTGPWLFGGSALITGRAPRAVGDARVALAPRFTSGLLAAHAFRSGAALALGVSWDVEDRATIDGVVIAGSARRALRITTGLQLRLGDQARFVASLASVPTIPVVTAGEAATFGLSLSVVHPWI